MPNQPRINPFPGRIEATVNGKPAILSGDTVVYLPESYELVRTVDDIVGVVDLATKTHVDLAFHPLSPGDDLVLHRDISAFRGDGDSDYLGYGRTGL